MGSSWSKLKKSVEKGDETKVLEIYNKNPEIRRKLNANSVINDYTLDTYMHICARHGMIEFLKLLLYENNGNPNKLNRRKQTVLHKVCEGQSDNVQYECMQLLLQWHDTSSSTSQLMNKSIQTINKQGENINDKKTPNTNLLIDINVNAKDDRENTPLHYAAMRNLPTCVQTLVAHGAYLFCENADHSTPCDLAERNGQKDIALYLESKMIFSKDDDEKENSEDLDQEVTIIEEKQNYGLRIQDLQEEKDKLLVETADMLRCNIFTAEILLKKHAWSKENLLNAWIEDPGKCCEKCGLSTAIIPQKIDKNLLLNANKYLKSNDGSKSQPNTSQDKNTSGLVLTNTFDNNNNNVIKPHELDSNLVIARKMSGRYLNKKLDSTNTLKTQTSPTNNAGSLSQTNPNDPLLPSSCKHTEKYSNNSVINNENLNWYNQSENVYINDQSQQDSNICGICFNDISENIDQQLLLSSTLNSSTSITNENFPNNNFLQVLCGHRFCRNCWQQYLTMKIEEGSVSDIVCPQTDCYAIISHEIVESLVSKETAQKYLQFDLKAFVDSNPSIKWCPFPGCGMAVRNPKMFTEASNSNLIMNELMMTQEQQNSAKEYSKSVDCGSGHYFCWDCLQEGHEPASCQNWKDWYQKILEIKPEELCNTDRKEEQSANYLWLVTNSKKCPNGNCNAPIQKNEGCNHVKCYRCKHDFCWICLEPWKKHSSATGGYFQCNRYEVSTKILQKEKATIAEAEEIHQKAVELNKFVHYYTRFKNHELSYKIEEPLLALAKTKFEVLTAQQNVSGSPSSSQQLHVKNPQSSVNSQASLMKNSNESLNQLGNSSQKQSSIPFVKRLSHSFEKGVSKLLTNPDWNILQSDQATISGSITSSPVLTNKLNATETTIIDESAAIANSIVDTSSTIDVNREKNLNELETVNETEETSMSANNNPNSNINTNPESHLFIEDAIRELLKARRILRCSYVYGYFLDTFGHKKFIFEFIQTEFEECTENLSQIIARPHLKTPKNKIIRLTNVLRRKRIEFLDTITRGLNSFNDTPPTLKKYSRQRWKYLLKDNIQNDDEFKNAIALSLKELNPKNPWIIDKKGRHTNLLALLNDWPELEHDLDSILVPSKEKNGLCAKWDCGNVRAVNTLSGSICNYCSIKCMRSDHNAYLEQKKNYGQQNPGKDKAKNVPTTSKIREPSLSSSPESALHFNKKSTNLNGSIGDNSNSSGSNSSKVNKSSDAPTCSGLIKKNFEDEDYFDYSMGFKTGDKAKNETNPNDQEEAAVDSDLLKAIEMSKIQQIIDSRKNSKNYNTFDTDFKRAIKLSLTDQKPDFNSIFLDEDEDTENTDNGSVASSKPAVDNESSADVKQLLNANIEPNKHVTILPYESLFVTANEKDISIIINNIENVIYDQKDIDNKVSKVFNFNVKNKKQIEK